MGRYFLGLTTAICAFSLVGSDAFAQYPPPQGQPPPGQPGAPAQGQFGGQWNAQTGGSRSGSGLPPPPPPSSGKQRSTALEVGFLYVTAAAWGVGTGIWIDAEAEIDDPGLALIFPGILGVAAPVGVFALDQYV